MSGDALTGGRATLLLGTLLPALVVVHYLRKPLAGSALLAIAAAGLVVFVGMRVATRDVVYEGREQSRTDVFRAALFDLPAQTVGGREVIAFDSLVTLVGGSQDSGMPLNGRTYSPIATFPIPRALWPDKPEGGGNAWFTRTYFPAYYGPHRIETSVSFVGESYANFGAAGVVVLPFALGLALSLLYRSLRATSDVRFVVAYALLLGYFFTLLRGDAFHSVTGAAMTFALLLVLWPVLTERVEGSATEAATGARAIA